MAIMFQDADISKLGSYLVSSCKRVHKSCNAKMKTRDALTNLVSTTRHISLDCYRPYSAALTRVSNSASRRAFGLHDVLFVDVLNVRELTIVRGPHEFANDILRKLCAKAACAISAYELLAWTMLLRRASDIIAIRVDIDVWVLVISCLSCAIKIVNDNAPCVKDLATHFDLDWRLVVYAEYEIAEHMFSAQGSGLFMDLTEKQVCAFRKRIQ